MIKYNKQYSKIKPRDGRSRNDDGAHGVGSHQLEVIKDLKDRVDYLTKSLNFPPTNSSEFIYTQEDFNNEIYKKLNIELTKYLDKNIENLKFEIRSLKNKIKKLEESINSRTLNTDTDLNLSEEKADNFKDGNSKIDNIEYNDEVDIVMKNKLGKLQSLMGSGIKRGVL